MNEYERKYVAIRQGKVVDSDEDMARLAQRVYGSFGYVPIYIDRVDKTPKGKLENPSPEYIRPT